METDSKTYSDDARPISSVFHKAVVQASPALCKEMKHFQGKKKCVDAGLKEASVNAQIPYHEYMTSIGT